VKDINESKGFFSKFKREFQDSDDYLRTLVDTFSALRLSKEVWLTDREKTFFIAVVKNYLLGIRDHRKKRADDIYNKVFGAHTKKSRTIWLNKLQEKRWIDYSSDEIEIPPLFRTLNLEEGQVNILAEIILSKDERYTNR
jgi:hypothetical protein